MIIPEDEQCIQRMTGLDQVPKDIADEYMLRARMYHRHTSGGPLGPSVLVAMLRHLGYGPPEVGDRGDGALDWRRVAEGQKVDYRRAGEWSPQDSPGEYAGFVSAGTLAVKTAGGTVDEFDRFNVRLHDNGIPDDFDQESMDTAGTMRSDAVDPDVRAELAEKGSGRSTQKRGRSQRRSGKGAKGAAAKALESLGGEDWAKVDSGTPVVVELDGGDHKGDFLKAKDDGTLIVSVSGQQKTVEPDVVRLAGDDKDG